MYVSRFNFQNLKLNSEIHKRCQRSYLGFEAFKDFSVILILFCDD